MSDAGLRAAWTRQLASWWRYYAREYAHDALREPRFALSSGTSTLGRWDRETREIAVSAAHVERDPWEEVMATLRHEMAHQYADEVLLALDELPHGPAFRRAAKILRVDGRARTDGVDTVAKAADDDAARLTRRVSKLLALGASPNEHEASAAIGLARALMLEHNLDVVARDEERGFRRVALGPVKRRHAAWENVLASILGEFYFVEVLWAPQYDALSDREGTALFAHGTPANLEMASYVHAFLSDLLPRLWDEHCRARGIASDRDRATYYSGVLTGFLASLRERERARRASSRALVWRGDPRLSAFLRWHHPRIRTTRFGGRGGDAFDAGREAGRRVKLHRPLGRGATASGRLLGPPAG